ncbi:MAG TPA: DUF4412 domain-containing protein [Puia sp.]
MKNNSSHAITLFIFFLFTISAKGQSGFMKDVLNAIQSTAQDRTNNAARQSTNKMFDQVDPSTQSKSHTATTNTSPSNASPSDTAALYGVLGAFARAAAANPNDTSAADLTMKALGLMAGGKQISAQDSAAVIKGYTTATGGSGLHYEYAITMSANKSTTRDSTELYFTNGGEGRSEIGIPMPGMHMKKMINIGHYDQPGYTIMLYPESKTYSLNILDTSLMIKGEENYQVTRMGTETIRGYPCVHLKIVSTTGSGRFKFSSTMDVWTSTAVPGYALYKKMTNLQTVKAGMIRALDNAGGSGVFVKWVASGNDYSMEQILIRAEEKKFPASLFLIPSDYAESKENSMYHMMPSAAK